MKKLWEKLNNMYVGNTYITWAQAIVYGMTVCVSVPLSIKVNNIWIDRRIDKKLGERES